MPKQRKKINKNKALLYTTPKLSTIGVRGVLKQPLTIADSDDNLSHTILNKKTTVLVEPCEWVPQINQIKNKKLRFKITTYTKDNGGNPDLPENSSNIVTGQSYDVANINPHEYFNFEEYFCESNSNILFPHGKPHIKDIKQGYVSNCSLLAALQAILSNPHINGAAIIQSMFQDHGDGTTTVRLYHPETLKPEYFRVSNAVIHNKNGKLSKHSALWVHVLENAYAARGLEGDNLKTNSSFASVYSGGIYEKNAFRSILGCEAKNIHSISPDPTLPIFCLKDTHLQEAIKFFHFLFINGQINKDEYEIHLKNMIPVFSNSIYKLFPVFPDLRTLEEIFNIQVQLFEYEFTHGENSLETASQSERENNKTLFEAYDKLKHFFEKYKKKDFFYRNYHINELKLYTQLQHSFNNGCALIAGCFTNEPVDGINSTHAYGVMGFEKKEVTVDDNNGVEQTTELLFVKLINPWGRKGRVYLQHIKDYSIKGKETEEGEFFIELKEFYRLFEVNVTESLVKPSVIESAKQNHEKEIVALLNKPILLDDYTLDQITEQRDYILLLKDKMMTYELFSLELFNEEEKTNIFSFLNKTQLLIGSPEHKRILLSLISKKNADHLGLDHDDAADYYYHLFLYQHLHTNPNNSYPLSIDEIFDQVKTHSPNTFLWESYQERLGIFSIYVSYEINQLNQDLYEIEMKLNRLEPLLDQIFDYENIAKQLAHFEMMLVWFKKNQTLLLGRTHELFPDKVQVIYQILDHINELEDRVECAKNKYISQLDNNPSANKSLSSMFKLICENYKNHATDRLNMVYTLNSAARSSLRSTFKNNIEMPKETKDLWSRFKDLLSSIFRNPLNFWKQPSNHSVPTPNTHSDLGHKYG